MRGEGVLLLGGGGFIGRSLAARLAERGDAVHILARQPLAGFDTSPVQIHCGNLGDSEVLHRLLPYCRTVVHLASESTPGSSAGRPTLEAGNILPTLALLEALQAHEPVHLIFFSSGGTLYGNPASLPVSETAAIAPLSYHGAGKAAQEAFMQAFRAQGRAVTVLRPSNTYGPGQSLRAGFGLVRTLLEHAHQGTRPEIWGDGEAIRDFVYVEDVVEACLRFVDKPEDSGTYNVGSGEGYSINAVARMIGEISGLPLPLVYRPGRAGDVKQVVLDISRLRAIGWEPRVSLAEGIRRTWEWLRRS